MTISTVKPETGQVQRLAGDAAHHLHQSHLLLQERAASSGTLKQQLHAMVEFSLAGCCSMTCYASAGLGRARASGCCLQTQASGKTASRLMLVRKQGHVREPRARWTEETPRDSGVQDPVLMQGGKLQGLGLCDRCGIKVGAS